MVNKKYYKLKYKRKKPAQIKKTETKQKQLPIYKVPKSIYEKALADIEIRKKMSKHEALARQRCHTTMYKYLNTTETPKCKQNFMEAAKQAFEGRNFLALYDILSKALEIRDIYLLQQVYEVMHAAILTDRSIADKEEALKRFALGVKLLEENQVHKLSENYLLIENSTEAENQLQIDDEEQEDTDFAEII